MVIRPLKVIPISLFFKDIELGKISYPVFVKPVRGSASLAISKVNDKETIELLLPMRIT